MVTTRQSPRAVPASKRAGDAPAPKQASRKPAAQAANERAPARRARPTVAQAVKTVKQVTRLIQDSPVGQAGVAARAAVRSAST